MSINAAIRRRQLGSRERIGTDFAIDQIRLKEVIKLPNICRDELEEFNQTQNGTLASTRLQNDIIAIANEDGYVNLIRTNKLDNITHWMAHENAIFDIKPSEDGRSLITASGDTTIRLWDIENKKEALKFAPHYSSIKSISVYDKNTLASGSRDGSIKIHDLRQKDPTVIIIRDAHRNTIIRKQSCKQKARTDPISCVTNVVFDPYFPRLFSAGANDATLKLWDLRKTGETNRPRRTREGHILINQPYQEVHYPSRGIHCGYSHLLYSSSRLYAACSDNKIYCYDTFGPNSQPTRFTGYRYDTYLKMAIMDDRYLFSGSKGNGALMWSLGESRSSKYLPETTKQPIGQLKPDTSDRFDTNVIETDWDSLSIIPIRDDGLVSKWTMQHVSDCERKKLASDNTIRSFDHDVTIEMSDIMNVNVLRPTNGSQQQLSTTL